MNFKFFHPDFRFDLTNKSGQIVLSAGHLYGLRHLERTFAGPLDVLNSPEYRYYTYKSRVCEAGLQNSH